MRYFPLFWGVFAGGKGQGGRRTQRFFGVFPGRGGAASTEIASWELGWRLKQRARGSWQRVAGLGSATISCALCIGGYLYHMRHAGCCMLDAASCAIDIR